MTSEITDEVCQSRLAEAQQAMHDLRTGQAIAIVHYGDRRVQYTSANSAELAAYIQQLEQQCGNCKRHRRPFGVSRW